MNNDHIHFTIACAGSSFDCFRRGASFNGVLGENIFPRTGVATAAAAWTQDSRIQWTSCAFHLAAFDFLASWAFTSAGAAAYCFSWQEPVLFPVMWAAIESLLKIRSIEQNLHFVFNTSDWPATAAAEPQPYGDNGENRGLTVWLTVRTVWHLQPYGPYGAHSNPGCGTALQSRKRRLKWPPRIFRQT